MDARRRKIDAVVQARVNRVLRGDHEELLRWLNFRGPTFGSSARLVELYRRERALPDDFALEWALQESANALRNLARSMVAARRKKKSMSLRQEFCDRLYQLLKDDVTKLGEDPSVRWSPAQMKVIVDCEQRLAPRLLLGLWEADPELLRRLRECAWPECSRWFVDESTKRPRRFCRPGHRVRMSERLAPVKEVIVDVLTRKRRVWVSSRDLAESAIPQALIALRGFVRPRPRHQAGEPDDVEQELSLLATTYFTMALSSLAEERRLQHRTSDQARGPESVEPDGWVTIGLVSQYRLVR